MKKLIETDGNDIALNDDAGNDNKKIINYRDRYKKISGSGWYKQAYKDKSVGETFEII